MEGGDQVVLINCQNCEKKIQQSKINLHFSYCKKNVKKCPQCNNFYDINYEQEHQDQFHAKIKCKHCSKQFPLFDFSQHEKQCGPKEMLCAYCDLKIPQQIYESHVSNCQSRTVVCDICQRPIAKKDIFRHDQICIVQFCEIQDNQNNEGLHGKKRMKKEQTKPKSVAVDIFKNTKPPRNSNRKILSVPLDLTEECENKKQKVVKQKEQKSRKQNLKEGLERKEEVQQKIRKPQQGEIIDVDGDEAQMEQQKNK